MERIIERAGVVPWPKVFHNLRASRQTELAERYPIHVVCAWLGNSEPIAKEHYLQVTEAHCEEAAQKAAQSAAGRDGQGRTTLRHETKKALADKGFLPRSIPVSTCDYPQGDSNNQQNHRRFRGIHRRALQNPVQFHLTRIWLS